MQMNGSVIPRPRIDGQEKQKLLKLDCCRTWLAPAAVVHFHLLEGSGLPISRVYGHEMDWNHLGLASDRRFSHSPGMPMAPRRQHCLPPHLASPKQISTR